MEFTLVYQGPLKANGSVKEKQEIRRTFHRQLQILWQQPPLSTSHDLLQQPSNGESVLKQVGAFTFAPLVSEYLRLTAHVDIWFLRPEAPGSLITQGGDIDNRLKTLFDALRMPKIESEIPNGDCPKRDENPFLCVLEDDNLITEVSVKTDRLLKPAVMPNHVHLLLRIATKAVVGTIGNMGLG